VDGATGSVLDRRRHVGREDPFPNARSAITVNPALVSCRASVGVTIARRSVPLSRGKVRLMVFTGVALQAGG